MPGIIVGIDGSAHSRQALGWAVNEASVRHAPLTVLTVDQAVAGYWTSPLSVGCLKRLADDRGHLVVHRAVHCSSVGADQRAALSYFPISVRVGRRTPLT
jgi:hypothetical protein